MRIASCLIVSFYLVSFLLIIPVSASSPDIIAISAGPFHCLALGDDGQVWEWGSNWRGELTGIPDNKIPHEIPELVPISNITAISAGAFCNVVLKDDGTVWWWGSIPNKISGGDPDAFNIFQVPITDVTAVYAGADYAFAIKDDGTVWAWGTTRRGYLGNGENNEDIARSEFHIQPVQSVISNVTFIDGNGCFAVKEDGTLWAWGDNVYIVVGNEIYICGKLGDFTDKRIIPVPFKVEMLTDVKSVSSGELHTLVCKNDGTVWAWGSNYEGQLGYGGKMGAQDQIQTIPVKAKIDNIKAVSAGYDISLALKNDGTVWSWGMIMDKTIGTSAPFSSPVRVDGLSEVTAIGSGYNYFMALKSDGSVWIWGFIQFGQAGINGQQYQYQPMQVSFDETINTPDAVFIPANFSAVQTVVITPPPNTSPLTGDTNGTIMPGDNTMGNDEITGPQQGNGLLFQVAGLALLICIIIGGIMIYKRK